MPDLKQYFDINAKKKVITVYFSFMWICVIEKQHRQNLNNKNNNNLYIVIIV